MIKFEELDHVSHSASDFGDGTISLDLLVTGGSLHCTVHIENRNDELVVSHTTVQDCVDEEEQPIDYDDAAVDKAVTDAMEANPSIMEDYERAVYDEQKMRAKMGELW